MVCVPCIFVPVFLFIWYRFLQPIFQPIFMRFYNPFKKVDETKTDSPSETKCPASTDKKISESDGAKCPMSVFSSKSEEKKD